MAFKSITDLSAEVTISLGGVNKKTGKKNPNSVEGYYLGSRTVEDRKKKSGNSYIYFFQTSKGNVGVWGKTDIDRKMGAVPVGSMTRITHTGMQATANGDMYKYSVEVDDENTIEVAPATSMSSSSNDSEQEEEYSASSEDDDFDEDAAQEAALAKAAKVQAILNRNKK